MSVALDRLADISQVVELGEQRADERRAEVAQQDARTRGMTDERFLEPDEIAGPGCAECRAGDETLEILTSP